VTALAHDFTPGTTGGASLLAGYNAPFDPVETSSADGAITIPYPAHARAALEVDAAHRTSADVRLSLPALVRYDHFSNDTDFGAASLALVIAQAHGALVRSELRGGAMVVKRLDTPGDDVSFFPRARAELWATSAPSETLRLEHHAAVTIEPFLDPVRAEYRSLGSIELATRLELLPRWTAALELAGSTTVSSEPLDPPELETYLEARTPTRYRVSDTSFVEFGTRFRARGPHLADPPFELTDFEFWGYAAFAFALGKLSPSALY
jgi:hypothetical protein